MFNCPEAEKAIKENAPALIDAAQKAIVSMPDKITETSDHGFSQGRRIKMGTETETYEVEVHLTVTARVKRPERERA